MTFHIFESKSANRPWPPPFSIHSTYPSFHHFQSAKNCGNTANLPPESVVLPSNKPFHSSHHPNIIMDVQELITREEVIALLREQAKTFDAKLEMAQKDRDAAGRRFADIEDAMPRLGQNVRRTESLKQNIQELISKSVETMDDVQTTMLTLKSHAANSSLEIARLHDHLASQGHFTSATQSLSAQHDRMSELITELERQQARTNARHASEGSLACNCAHKTINEKMGKMATRISSVSATSAVPKENFTFSYNSG